MTVSGLSTLRKRAEFVSISNNGRRIPAKGLILQVMENSLSDNKEIRVGFTVSKRVGNAVERNRAKRKLREAAKKVMPELAKPDCDYVIVGRTEAVERPFSGLVKDLKYALHKAHS